MRTKVAKMHLYKVTTLKGEELRKIRVAGLRPWLLRDYITRAFFPGYVRTATLVGAAFVLE